MDYIRYGGHPGQWPCLGAAPAIGQSGRAFIRSPVLKSSMLLGSRTGRISKQYPSVSAAQVDCAPRFQSSFTCCILLNCPDKTHGPSLSLETVQRELNPGLIKTRLTGGSECDV
jgi:hypothetical protein